jgi:LacI family transcriptional regulator
VAQRAGVHLSTVSRALAQPDLVAPATRAKVEVAARQLGFTPNRLARNLVQGRMGAIGLLVPDIANPYFASVVQAAQAEAALHDLVVLLADTRHEPTDERRALDMLQPNVDGLIVCSPVGTRSQSGMSPTVFVNRRARGKPNVTVDQHAIVRLAFDHLAGLGHRHIVWLNGPNSYWSSRRRAAAIERVSAGVGRDDSVVPDCEPTFAGGWQAGAEALSAGATAIVAFNDLMALGVLAAAHDADRSVPRDLSIVGSDDIPSAAMAWPPLTSVAAPLDDLGRSAVRALLHLLEDGGTVQTVLEPTLSIRASTGSPSS